LPTLATSCSTDRFGRDRPARRAITRPLINSNQRKNCWPLGDDRRIHLRSRPGLKRRSGAIDQSVSHRGDVELP
jgi:hypothetical protein